jgi:hypothetical protein
MLLGVLVGGATQGCLAADASDVEGGESADDISTPGRWQLPATLVSRAGEQFVGYDGGPAWEGGRNCTNTTPGSEKLRKHLLAKFPGTIRSIGGYSCRPNTASPEETSLHGTGRALDVMIPTTRSGRADNTRGDKVAHYLVEHAEELQVQYIIWDQSSWSPGSEETAPYGGPNPHVDHIHVEITEDAANLRATWYR